MYVKFAEEARVQWGGFVERFIPHSYRLGSEASKASLLLGLVLTASRTFTTFD